MITGTIADGMSNSDVSDDALSVEHPSGEFSVTLEIDRETSPPTVKKVGLLRTTRLLSRGEVFIPAGAES